MKFLDRRTVLRGFGGSAIALPFLDVMAHPRPARAASAIAKMGTNGQPKRFVAIFSPCGQGPDWLKTTNGPDGKIVLEPALKPLERHKNDLLLFASLDNRSALFDSNSIDGGHSKPMGNLMTQMGVQGQLGGGISIDQAIANEVRGDTKFPSLQLSIQPGGAPVNQYMSYSKAGVPLVSISDPQRVFTKLFTDFKTDPAALLKVQARRKSVLDGVKEDYAAFAQDISGDDRAKIDVHLDAIREVEKQIQTKGVEGGQACTKPAMPAKGSNSGESYIADGKAQWELLAIAFACDLTRVATLMFQGSGGNVRLPGFNRGIHDSSHQTFPYPMHSNTPQGTIERNKYTEWHANYFAGFFDKLKALPDAGGGTIFDNTLVYWCTEHGMGDHNYDRTPVLVAGSAGGYFKTGRALSYPNTGTGLNYCQAGYCPGVNKLPNPQIGANGPGLADLYVSFLNAMGVQAATFGNPKYCKGPLPDLTG